MSAPTTTEDRLGPRAKDALRAIRSSTAPAVLVENSVQGLLIEGIAGPDDYERMAQEPTVASSPRIPLTARHLGKLAGITAHDVERRIAECVSYVLEDPELAPEARIGQALDMLHALTGGMKPRR